MEKVNIFLLDLSSSSNLCYALEEILCSVPNIAFRLRREPVEEAKSALCSGELCKTISGNHHDLIFVVLPPKKLELCKPLLQSIITEAFDLQIIILTEACKPDEIFSLLRLGIADFITPPIKAIDIIPRLWRLLDRKQKTRALTHRLKEKFGLKQLIGESPVFLEETKKIPIVAMCDAGVLITGETGTGKEMFARAIHYLSPRADKPFIAINCGAFPGDLFENELFGHVRGAFTGAVTPQPGLIREANCGTLFLDDIDCLPVSSQITLLRFLQEKEYRQIGSAKLYRADVRVIAATNTDLERAVTEGKIRQDLFYRLSIVSFKLPSLQERQRDIPLLVKYFIEKYAIEFDKKVTGIDVSALNILMFHHWPGNVRELEHVIERAVLFSKQPEIGENDIIIPLKKASFCIHSFKEAKADVVNKFEKKYIKNLLLTYQGNITKAAQAAQKNRRAFWQLIRKHRINVQTFKP